MPKPVFVANVSTASPTYEQLSEFTFPIHQKWNLLSLPLSTAYTGYELLKMGEGVVDQQMWYWGQTNSYYLAMDETEVLQLRDTFWVYGLIDDSSSLSIIGLPASQGSLTLQSGWNQVGVTDFYDISLINLAYPVIWRWNPETQQYVQEEDMMVPGLGYWIYSQ